MHFRRLVGSILFDTADNSTVVLLSSLLSFEKRQMEIICLTDIDWNIVPHFSPHAFGASTAQMHENEHAKCCHCPFKRSHYRLLYLLCIRAVRLCRASLS
jgi:hypothetical protein